MKHWFTQPDAPITSTFVKRFDPQHWTIDFPRGAMGSVVGGEDKCSMTARACFLRKGDLVGLQWLSEDVYSHPSHRREASSDYSRCQLSFRWEAQGLVPLDAVNGPTLTIEGDDAAGNPRTWYVRLWNYAAGQPDAADIRLDFDALDGGFLLPGEADRVYPKAIRRMFISLAPLGYVPGSEEHLPNATNGSVTLSNIQAEGSGSVLRLNDAIVPEHRYRICTAYDDLYHLTPERVVESIERLGYRKVINHYVGMSHYFGLGQNGLIDVAQPLNAAALAWHKAFAKSAHERGFRVIWSLSYELLDMFCPEAWKQRSADGQPALTGYVPPSTLVSPAHDKALQFLTDVALAFCKITHDVGASINFQIGEPWWWVTADQRICLYDEASRVALGGSPLMIPDVRAVHSAEACALLDSAGTLLASSTAKIVSEVKRNFPGAVTHLLTYLPGSLRPDAPELRRANMPLGWSYPAFDVLQLEDYEWVTGGRGNVREQAISEATRRLGYSEDRQHYLAGFAANPAELSDWERVIAAAEEAEQRSVAEVFIWALPQVLRDGLTIFDGEKTVQAFDDVLFPIEIGAEASASPAFSTAVVTSASGHEFRNSNWGQARLHFDAGPGIRSEEELQRLLSFFRARRGSAIGFRFRDPFDHSSAAMSGTPSCRDQELGNGDGVRTRFNLVKRYGQGEVRHITRPVAGSVAVSVNDVEQPNGWVLRPGGVVEFDEPPKPGALIKSGFVFDVPVRFAGDRLEVNRVSFNAGEAPSVPLIEVRES